MEITEYKLVLTQKIDDTEIIKQLIYRGNENIIITDTDSCSEIVIDDDKNINDVNTRILIPRHILEKFIEMINE